MSDMYTAMFGDADLLIGANYGSNVTVSEIIVVASNGGGNRVDVEFEYYRENIDQDHASTVPEFTQWSDDFRAEVKAFADAHVLGDSSSSAYKQAHEAISALYALAKLKFQDPHETGWFVANNHTFTWSEILSSLSRIEITVAPHGDIPVAYADTGGFINKIYIDPTRVATYNPWFSTPAEAINYLIYHELAHAFDDGEADKNNPAFSQVQREARANRYGQVLAGVNGAEYPSNSELIPFDGTP